MDKQITIQFLVGTIHSDIRHWKNLLVAQPVRRVIQTSNASTTQEEPE
jgi:hypothetical protein